MITRGKRKLPLFHWLFDTHSQSPPWHTFTVPTEQENSVEFCVGDAVGFVGELVGLGIRVSSIEPAGSVVGKVSGCTTVGNGLGITVTTGVVAGLLFFDEAFRKYR